MIVIINLAGVIVKKSIFVLYMSANSAVISCGGIEIKNAACLISTNL